MARKIVRIILVGDAQAEYNELERKVADEKRKGVLSSFHQTLFRSIDAKFRMLREHYDYGEQIPCAQIPKKYTRLGATNLWKVDLSGYWRMIYALRQPSRDGAEIEIM